MKKYTDKQAIDELMQQIDEIDAVRKKPRMSPKFKSWQNKTAELLGHIYGRKAKPVKDFDNIVYGLAVFSNQTPESKFDEAFQQGLMNAAVVLSSIVKDMQKNGIASATSKSNSSLNTTENPDKPSGAKPAPSPAPAVNRQDQSQTEVATTQPGRRSVSMASGVKLFVVCAEENKIKHELSNFLSKVGLSPVYIQEPHEQQYRLLDKLKEHSDVGFAVVLLDPTSTSLSNDIVFELGILVGALGSERVCGLSKSTVDILANYSGISYISFDNAGAWKFMMIKQLRQAGFNVDANLAL